jgi:hypothetical protein
MRMELRDRVDRSWLSAGSTVPAVSGPGFGDKAADNDDRFGEDDECVDDAGAPLGADLELPESSGVPEVRAFDDSAGAGLEGFALRP